MEYNKKVSFTKIRDVKSPLRGTSVSAGTDVYVPEFNEVFYQDLCDKNKDRRLLYQTFIQDDGSVGLEIIVPSGGNVAIPSGIKACIHDERTYLEVANRSGVASKRCFVYGAHVIDADYRGELIYDLHNISGTEQIIRTGERICQLIHKIKIDTEWEEIGNEEFSDNYCNTERGDGGFGHTGMK